MAVRPSILFMFAGALASLGAAYQTPNFIVEAPTPAIAQQIGQYAEHYRKEKAIQWLGQEMPQWGRPCPVAVTVTGGGAGGATSFAFDRGQILSIDMHIEGTLDRLLASVLPHEVTHTVFAYRFRCPVPRWADEGGSVLSEDTVERNRHEHLVRQILNTPGRAIPLRRLFQLRDYPRDVMVLYAEGYSVTNYLVNLNGRSNFLAFVARGMNGNNWDEALRTHFGINSVEDLERTWWQHVLQNRPGGAQLASSQGTGQAPGGNPVSRVVVRQTVPPVQPILEPPQPIYRGQAPDQEPEAPRSSGWNARPAPPPPPAASFGSAPTPGWSQAPAMPPPPPAHPQVRLGAPQFDAAPPAAQPSSPVGYSPP